ncbi:hypothetical protein ACWDOP_12310 [Nocardia sp. NPDC003693]
MIDAMAGDREAQQRRVLTAACEVFGRRGFHAAQMLQHDPAVRGCTDRAIDDCVHAVAGFLARDPHTDLDQARLVAAGLMGICRFTAQYWVDGGCRVPKEHAIATAVTLCVRGISASSRPR